MFSEHRGEAVTVRRFDQMNHFMNDNVFDQIHGLLYEFFFPASNMMKLWIRSSSLVVLHNCVKGRSSNEPATGVGPASAGESSFHFTKNCSGVSVVS